MFLSKFSETAAETGLKVAYTQHDYDEEIKRDPNLKPTHTLAHEEQTGVSRKHPKDEVISVPSQKKFHKFAPNQTVVDTDTDTDEETEGTTMRETERERIQKHLLHETNYMPIGFLSCHVRIELNLSFYLFWSFLVFSGLFWSFLVFSLLGFSVFNGLF